MATLTETVPASIAPPAAASARPSRQPDGDIELQPTVLSRRPKQQPVEVEAGGDQVHTSGGDRDASPPLDAASPPYLKLLSCGFSFFFSGVNDGTLGPLVPYIQKSFSIGTGEIAIIYATSFTGWFLAGLLNPFLTPPSPPPPEGPYHRPNPKATTTGGGSSIANAITLGRILTAGAALQLLAQALRAVPIPHLTLPMYAAAFFVQTFGMALQDAHGNTFVSSAAAKAHRWLGFIHASYAGGLLLGPPVATAIASTAASSGGGGEGGGTAAAMGDGWTRVYFVLLALGVVNLVGVVIGFRDGVFGDRGGGRGDVEAEDVVGRTAADAASGREGSGAGGGMEGVDTSATATAGEIRNSSSNNNNNNSKNSPGAVALQDVRDLLKLRSFWMLGLFYCFELGWAITAGGWVVDYLVKVRAGELSKMGYVPTGFNAGLLLGRVLLVEPTFRFGERRMLLVYSAALAGLQLVFWLVPNVVASATALSIMGFLFGPFFATGISVGSKLFPRKIRASGLSFVFVVAQAGGALFPALTGLIATRAGVQVLQPIVLGLIVAGGMAWWFVPQVPSRDD